MPSSYNKPHLTFTAQLDKLKRRGMQITDEPTALSYLARVGYYHLSGYWYVFREPGQLGTNILRGDNFVAGTRLSDVVDLYVFDKRLRLLMLDAIERVEIAMRVDIAYRLGTKDIFAQTNVSLLDTSFTTAVLPQTESPFDKWATKRKRSITLSSDQFVQHFRVTYGFPLPIWVDVELWDFGDLSKFFEGMMVKDKRFIARRYGTPHWYLVQSWLRCLVFVRNVSAHHGRLWNRNIVEQPRLPSRGQIAAFDAVLPTANTTRLYPSLCVLAFMMMQICPNSTWRTRVVELMDQFPLAPRISVANMGFPSDWRTHPFWIL